jgi:acetyl esterase/lipase
MDLNMMHFAKKVRLSLALAFTAIGFCLVPTPSNAELRTPAEAFAVLPIFSNVAISADGKKLAYSAPREDGNLDVVVYTLATKTVLKIGVATKKLRQIQFEDGGKILVTTSVTSNEFDEKVEFTRIFSINLADGKIQTLFTTSSHTRSLNSSITLSGLLPNAPDTVMISAYDTREAGFDPTYNLYRVPLDSNIIELTSLGTLNTYQWQADQMGHPVARAELNLVAKTSSLWLKGEGAEWRKVVQVENSSTEAIILLGVSEGGKILFQRRSESEFGEIEAVDPKTDQISVVLKADGIDLQSVITDIFSQKMLGVRVGGLNPDIRWTNLNFTAAQALLEGQFPGKIISIVDYTPDFKQFIASVETSSEPKKFYLLDTTKPSLSLMGPSMPSLSNVAMGNVKATTFKSRDGVDIPVYVTTPPGHTDAKNAPTIIFPHGGPASRDEPRFDWWAQFMASRGYVVIQPQFRGSTGFGAEFEEAGERQWGKRMQDDVSDAVAWAVKEGMTDARRTCIVGASYGGYAALAGATMTPDLYICAVSVAGVSDLPQMMREERADAGGRRSSTVNYWANHIGSDDRAAMEAASPRRLAGDVRAPILLIHGKDDTVVKFNQSRTMANALRAANKPFKLVELAGEDHWLSRGSTRLQMLREIDAFLAENLGPGLE